MHLICLQGSIEHAASQLETYRAMLEKEVITNFDKAVHQKDLGTMAECAQVMKEFERGETALMQVSCLLLQTTNSISIKNASSLSQHVHTTPQEPAYAVRCQGQSIAQACRICISFLQYGQAHNSVLMLTT